MTQLHLFNPGYEAGILPGKTNYTPTRNVQQLRKELALLPLWYGEPEDYVWVENSEAIKRDISFPQHLSFPTLVDKELWEDISYCIPPLQAMPWGLSPQSIRFFETLSCSPHRELTFPQWKEEYVALTSRETAALCLKKMREKLSCPLPELPLFCSSVEAVEDYIANHTPPFALKMPYSSSGRGLLRIEGNSLPEKEKEWLTGALRKQGRVSIEPLLKKEKDIAMEFYLNTEGKAIYKGLSLFETEGWKSYCGNQLGRQSYLRETIFSLMTDSLSEIERTVKEVIEELFGGIYSGYLGVDMMIYTDKDGSYRLHPCIEINMRYTMGMVAIRLFERLVHPDSKGVFRVLYEPKAYEHHHRMALNAPQEWKDGKLSRGYLSLAPIRAESCYHAYILLLP